MANDSKTKKLLKNTGILAVGNFGSKILVFLLVPLYTAVLSTEEYGSYDIIYSSVSLLIPLLTLNISDSLLRFPMDENANVPRIARFGLILVLASSIIVLAIQLVPGLPWSDLAGAFWIAPLYASMSLYQSLTFLARGLERMWDIAIAGIVSSILLVGLNIMFLLFLGWGLSGFFAANVFSLFLPAIWLLFRMRTEIFSSSNKAKSSLYKKMVRYALPLATGVIGWWLIGASDRFIVLALCGLEANGLYSIAYRIPSILSTVSTIFIQAWQVSAIKNFDSKDKDGFLRNTFFSVEAVVVLSSSIMIVLSPFIGNLLFSGDFYPAWVYVPLLLVFVTLNAMSGMWGPFFSVNFDSGPMAWSTIFAGVINVVFAIPLVILIGVQGACFSSVLAGFANWLFRAHYASRYFEVSFKICRSLTYYIILTLQACIMSVDIMAEVRIGIGILFLVLFIFLFREYFLHIIHFLMRSPNSR